MTWTTYCDRCGQELYRHSSIRAQRFSSLVDGQNGTLVAELCEACSIKLTHWLDTGKPEQELEE